MSTEIDSDALICSEGIIIDQQSVYKSLSIIIAVSLLLVSVTVGKELKKTRTRKMPPNVRIDRICETSAPKTGSQESLSAQPQSDNRSAMSVLQSVASSVVNSSGGQTISSAPHLEEQLSKCPAPRLAFVVPRMEVTNTTSTVYEKVTKKQTPTERLQRR